MTMPGFIQQQIVGPNGIPIYGSIPQNSAYDSPQAQMQMQMGGGMFMPQGIMGVPMQAGVSGAIGNTPMTDSVSALSAILQEQVSQTQVQNQMLSQMHSTMRTQNREIAAATAIQTKVISEVLTQIRDELTKGTTVAQAAQAGPTGGPTTNHPVDEQIVTQQGAQDAQLSETAHPVDAPEATTPPPSAGITTGHQRFRRTSGGNLAGSRARPQRQGPQLSPGMPEPYATRAGGVTPGPIPPQPENPPHFGPAPASGRAPETPRQQTLQARLTQMGFQAQGVTRMRFHEGRASFSIPGVARMIAGHAAQAMSDYEEKNFRYEYDDQGNISRVLRVRTPGVIPETGEVVGGAEGRAAAARGEQAVLEDAGPVSRRLQTALGYGGRNMATFATEGTLGSMLGPLEGPLGIAVGGAIFGTHELQKQREKNLFYQQASGEGNWQAGIAGRAHAEAFGIRNIFTMPGSMAREIYQGVYAEAPGTTTESRQMQSGALDFAVHQYRKTGMDVATSMELIRTSIRNGVQSFNDLDTAITSVSTTAKDAGQNSMVAIKNFSQLYGAILGNVTGSGSTATQIAATFTNLQTQWGRQAGFTAENFLGTTQGQGFKIGAIAAGLNPINAQVQVAQGGSQATRIQGQVTEGSYRMLWQDLGGQDLTTDALQIAQGMDLPRDKSGKVAGSDAQRQVAAQLLTSRGMSLDAVTNTAAALGLGQWTQEQALQRLGALALNGGDIGAESEANKQSASAGGYAAKHPTQLNSGQKIITARSVGAQGSDTARGRGIGAAGGITEGHASKGETALGVQTNALYTAVGTESEEARKYVAMVNDTGRRSALAEALLKAEKSYKHKQFVVQTKDGPKTVSYHDLFSNYKDQLRTGNVIDAQTGNRLSDADELNVAGTGKDLEGTASAGRKAPKGAKNFSATAGSGEVTIKPSSELQRWFTFITSGGITVDQANRNAVPANAFYPDPSQMPSATGN